MAPFFSAGLGAVGFAGVAFSFFDDCELAGFGDFPLDSFWALGCFPSFAFVGCFGFDVGMVSLMAGWEGAASPSSSPSDSNSWFVFLID